MALTSAGAAAAERIADELRAEMREVLQGIVQGAARTLVEVAEQRLFELRKAMLHELVDRERVKDPRLRASEAKSAAYPKGDAEAKGAAEAQSAANPKGDAEAKGAAEGREAAKAAGGAEPEGSAEEPQFASKACGTTWRPMSSSTWTPVPLVGSSEGSRISNWPLASPQRGAAAATTTAGSAAAAPEAARPSRGAPAPVQTAAEDASGTPGRGSPETKCSPGDSAGSAGEEAEPKPLQGSGAHLQTYMEHLGMLKKRDAAAPKKAPTGRRRAWSKMLESTGGGLGQAADEAAPGSPESDNRPRCPSRRASGLSALDDSVATYAMSSDSEDGCSSPPDYISRGLEDFKVVEKERLARERLERRLAQEADARRRQEEEEEEDQKMEQEKQLEEAKRQERELARKAEAEEMEDSPYCSICRRKRKNGRWDVAHSRWLCDGCWRSYPNHQR